MTDRETDYVAWTQRQAAALRSLPAAKGLDAAGLADEIEGMGRLAVSKASTPLVDLLASALFAHLEAGSELAEPHLAEMVERQADAAIASAHGVDRHLDLNVIWKRAGARAAKQDQRVAQERLAEACPVSIERLLEVDFDPYAVVAEIARCGSSAMQKSAKS